ncbi:YcxB family protein [Terriglobus sp.]|uniref:YcxB family protein n=1 Tax=Terriglobus sp. TaxID=1889013 RepID=UPI003B00FE3C
MDTPIHEYTATKRDFADAQRVHRKNRPWAAVNYWFWYAAVPVGCVLYVLTVAVRWHLHSRTVGGGEIVGAGFALYVAALLAFARWWQRRKLWNQAQPKKYRGKPVTVQFDESIIIGARPGESEGRFYWTAIEDFAEDDRMALVYVRPKLFLFIPKRAMSEPEWARLRALALPRKAKR